MSSEAPADWRDARLGDLLKVEHGCAFKSDHFTDFTGDEPIVVAIGNFKYSGGFRFEDTAIKGYDADYPERFRLSPGDILLVMTCQTQGGEILGIPARVPADGRTYLHNQRIGKVRFVSNEIDPDFAYWLFLTQDFNDELCRSATGSKILHTAPARIEAYTFKLPPLPVQRRIAHVLSSLDEKMASNQRLIRLLDETVGMLHRRLYAEVAGADPDDNPSLPEGWQLATLGDLGTVRGGGTPNSKVAEYWDPAEVVWVTPRDMTSLAAPVVYDSARRISPEGLDRSSAKLLPAGTVLYTSRATLGHSAIARCALATNQGFIAVEPFDEFSSEFVLMTLRDRNNSIVAKANGSTFLEVNKSNFKSVPFLEPPAEERRVLDRVVRPLFGQIEHLDRENKALADVQAAVLPRLLGGQAVPAEATTEVAAPPLELVGS